MPDQFIYTRDDVLRMLDALLAGEGEQWDGFFADRAKPCPFLVESPDENLAEWFGDGRLTPGRDSGYFHHVAPHRRQDYAGLVQAALKPGGSYGLVCFRPEGGSGCTDQQVYKRASLGYSADRLRALWNRAPCSVAVLRQMHKADPGGGALRRAVLVGPSRPGESPRG